MQRWGYFMGHSLSFSLPLRLHDVLLDRAPAEEVLLDDLAHLLAVQVPSGFLQIALSGIPPDSDGPVLPVQVSRAANGSEAV